MTPSLLDIRLIGLMAAAAVIRRFVPSRWRVVYGAVTSALLIGLASPETLALIGGATLFLLYPLAAAIRRLKARPGGTRLAGLLVIAGAVAMVALWFLLKASRTFALPFLAGSDLGARLAAVFGFSYFLFKGINYLYANYLADHPERSPWRALYFALLPATLTSGPIQKYGDFCNEVALDRQVDAAAARDAVYRITKGYFFKICVAGLLKAVYDRVMAIPSPNAYQVLALVAANYVYFFFDFAAYSHIAIGFGALMGLRVPENFRMPFLATSMAEFWRHWHITIGDWFRDHVFVPLGGMRLGGLRAAFLAGAIMLVCGLWHGFTVMFLLWGLWHGSMIFLDGALGVRTLPPSRRHGPRYWGRVAWTNARCAAGGLFFLPASAALPLLKGMTRWW